MLSLKRVCCAWAGPLVFGLALADPPAAPPSGTVSAPVNAPASAPRSAAEAPVLAALPAAARMLLTPRMTRHIRDLKALRGKIQARDWADVRLRAQAIADEPRLAPAGPQDALNAALPPEFFTQQAALHAAATALVAGATAQDVDAAEAAFDALSITCVRCHGQLGPPPHAATP